MKNSSFFTTLPLHNQLILATTQSTIDTSKVMEYLQETASTNSWNNCLQIAHIHAVLPHFFKAAKPHFDLISKEHQTFLTKLNKEIALENIKLSAELINIVKTLNDQNLPYISIKGPALSQEIYQDITIRQICDLDMLVDETDLLLVADILSNLGYESTLPLSLLKNQGFISLDNDFTFLHPDKKIMVELHWKLFPTRHKMPLNFKTLYQDVKYITIKNQAITTLSIEHNLLYLTLHASKHVFEQLKWVCDIDRLIRNSPDLNFNTLYDEAKTIEVQEPFLLGLLMSHELYETPLPSALMKKATPTTKKLLKQALHYFQTDFTALLEPEKKRIRFLFLQTLHQEQHNRYLALLTSAFKPSSVDYIYYQLPSKLNFLYPLLRPPRLLYKYVIKKILS